MINKNKVWRLTAKFYNFDDVYSYSYKDFEDEPKDQDIEDWLYIKRAQNKYGRMESELSTVIKIEYDNRDKI